MPGESPPDHSRSVGTIIVPAWSLKEDRKIDDCVRKKSVNQVPSPVRRAFKADLPKVFAFQITCLPLCHHHCWEPNDEDADVKNPKNTAGAAWRPDTAPKCTHRLSTNPTAESPMKIHTNGWSHSGTASKREDALSSQAGLGARV